MIFIQKRTNRIFTTSLLDKCYHSHNPKRSIGQVLKNKPYYYYCHSINGVKALNSVTKNEI